MGQLDKLVPLLVVGSMERSLRHYVDGLGFAMKNKWIDGGKLRWCWLDRDGVALMLQEARDDRKPDGRVGEGVSLCVSCADAVVLYRELVGRGVAASEPEVGNSMWVTRVADPDGYRLELASPTDVPEDTLLSEWKG